MLTVKCIGSNSQKHLNLKVPQAMMLSSKMLAVFGKQLSFQKLLTDKENIDRTIRQSCPNCCIELPKNQYRLVPGILIGEIEINEGSTKKMVSTKLSTEQEAIFDVVLSTDTHSSNILALA